MDDLRTTGGPLFDLAAKGNPTKYQQAAQHLEKLPVGCLFLCFFDCCPLPRPPRLFWLVGCFAVDTLYSGWTQSCTTLKPWLKPLFVGIYRGIIGIILPGATWTSQPSTIGSPPPPSVVFLVGGLFCRDRARLPSAPQNPSGSFADPSRAPGPRSASQIARWAWRQSPRPQLLPSFGASARSRARGDVGKWPWLGAVGWWLGGLWFWWWFGFHFLGRTMFVVNNKSGLVLANPLKKSAYCKTCWCDW